MSRTPMNENLSRTYNQEAEGWQNKSWGDFQKSQRTIDSGGQVAADPFENAGYLANQNKLTAGSLNQAENSGKQQISDLNRRTGGLNAGADAPAIAGLALGKARLSDQLTAQRKAQDYSKNIAYQQWAAGLPLEGFGAATSARNDAQDQLTKYGVNTQNEWSDILKGAVASGQAAAAAAAGG